MTAAVLSAPLLSALAMTVIVALRYVASSGFFAWLTERKRPAHYAGLGRQIRMEIGWSLASAAIYGVPAGIVAWGWREHGWSRIYSDWTQMPLWWLPVSFLLYLFLQRNYANQAPHIQVHNGHRDAPRAEQVRPA